MTDYASNGDKPEIGHACDGIREGYFKNGVGKYIIYYRHTDKNPGSKLSAFCTAVWISNNIYNADMKLYSSYSKVRALFAITLLRVLTDIGIYRCYLNALMDISV